MAISGVAMVAAARVTSHMTAVWIALHVYLYLQITQIAVAGVALRNVVAARPMRRLVLAGLAGTTAAALLVSLFMAAVLDETSLVDDLLDRIGSEPFFALDLLVDPLHPIVDLLSSYYLRSVETETIGRQLSDLLVLTTAILLFRDLPLGLFVTFSRRLRVRCEGEVHDADHSLNPVRRTMARLRRWFRAASRNAPPRNAASGNVAAQALVRRLFRKS